MFSSWICLEPELLTLLQTALLYRREHRGYLATWLEKDLRFFSLLVLPKNWMARIGCSKLYDTIIHLLFFCWRVREMLPKSFSIIPAVKCFYETEPEIWDSLNCIGSSWMSCTAFKLKCLPWFFLWNKLEFMFKLIKDKNYIVKICFCLKSTYSIFLKTLCRHKYVCFELHQ